MTRLVCSVVTTLAVTLALAAPVRAQDFEAAGKHFSAAQEAFGAKHFKTAATEFEAAYGITKDPVLLYNVGESWEKAGDGHKAVANYKAYLKEQPNAQDRAEVQKRIAAIETKHYRLIDQSSPGEAPVKAPTTAPATPPPAATIPATPPVTTPITPPPLKEPGPTTTAPPSTSAAPPSVTPAPSTAPSTTETTPTNTPPAVAPTPQATTSAPEPAVTPPPPAAETQLGLLDEGPRSKLRIAAWIGVATTLAVLTAGGIFGLAAESRADEINRRLSFVDMNGQPHKFDQSTANDLNQLKDDGNLYNGLAIGFYTVAAVGAVATVTMFIVDAKRKPEKQQSMHFAPVVGKNVGGFALGGSF
jgi:hypothetical protein